MRQGDPPTLPERPGGHGPLEPAADADQEERFLVQPFPDSPQERGGRLVRHTLPVQAVQNVPSQSGGAHGGECQTKAALREVPEDPGGALRIELLVEGLLQRLEPQGGLPVRFQERFQGPETPGIGGEGEQPELPRHRGKGPLVLHSTGDPPAQERPHLVRGDAEEILQDPLGGHLR